MLFLFPFLQNLIIFGENYSKMGHHGKLRSDKTCLNCGHQVEERFCPRCGQENIEPKQPFHYLFTHFFEDFTHYDGQFWGTLKNLLFNPGKLTTTYLKGERQKYVPPVKLYIFMSFITFLMVAFLPISVGSDHNEKDEELIQTQNHLRELSPIEATGNIVKENNIQKEDSIKIQMFLKTTKDSLIKKNIIQGDLDNWKDQRFLEGTHIKGANNIKQYDSIQAKNPMNFTTIERPIVKKAFELHEQGATYKDVLNGLIMTFFHSLPKALFLYLPIFALTLWLFHSKKKFWYFDHGVFTLHYFSFLLVEIAIVLLLSLIAKWFPFLSFFKIIASFFATIFSIYSCIYFFIAHYKVYRTHPITTGIAGISLFFINTILFTFLLMILILISFLMIH